ncbi:MAG TPA: FAD-dependent oxidoreductase [Vicinamibacterales bacterium]|nr:FAD-dependent oxidoreductase [Vicinamibacterales bacterium]
MVRDVQQLTARTYDVLVVGGGIYGLAIARDAALRGLSVALIERDDFGGGNSFNHARTIHGGLRYLQTLDITRSRESVAERRALARMAPHALKLLPFAVPLRRSVTKGRLAMRAGFLLDRVVARERNDGVAPSLKLPAGRVLSRSEAIDRFPGMRRQGLTGAALFYDYVTVEADRLTLSWALSAAAAGAVLANYVEAVAPIREQQRVTGVRARDVRSGADLSIAARLTVNATAAGIEGLLAPLGLSTGVPLLKALNLVTSREAGEEAIAARASSGRNLFLVPWRGRALFGTWESAQPCSPGDSNVTAAEVGAFLAELNDAFPGLDLTPADVTLVHRGLVPAARTPHGVALEKHEQIRDHAAAGMEGIVSVAGTKYTTARAVAERVTDLIMAKLQKPPARCRTMDPLPGGAIDDPVAAIGRARAEYDALLPSDALPHLIAAYGSEFTNIAELAGERREWSARVSDTSPVIGAQLVWAVRHEMALTLADAVVRRTPLGALGYPGDAAVGTAAAIVGQELAWSDEERRAEVGALRRFYGTLNAWNT